MEQSSELVKEIQKGLLQWCDFDENSRVLYVGKQEDANAEMLLVPALIDYGEDRLITPEQAGPLYVRNHVAQTIEERKKLKEAKSS